MARASSRVIWLGSKVTNAIHNKLTRRLGVVGEIVASYARESISTPTRTAGPSLPGEPPHADTGTLRKSVEWKVDEKNLTVEVGSNIPYALMLEQGTANMAARPFLVPSVENTRALWKRVLTKPMR